MTTYQHLPTGMRIAVALATVAVASCTSSSSHEMQQVEASNPSVTYEYLGDEELLQAQQNAVAFCSQYGAAPRAARITSGSSDDSSNHVAFECDPSLPAAAPPQQVVGSDLTYYYGSDQELLDASRSAQAYCTDQGWQRAVPSIRTNSDGSRAVLFHCA
jgi:hypothetical protein